LSHSRDPRHTPPEAELDSPAAADAGASNAAAAETQELRAAADAKQPGLRHEADVLARLEAEREEMRQLLIRRQADFENFRKRVERERREDRERAVAALGEAMLPVLDNFERALAAHQDPGYEDYRRGFQMIHRQLADLLAEYGIQRMECTVGKPFDPHWHHAFERVETAEHPEGTVLAELQAGYKYRDRVLRPAQVRVAVQPGPRAAESTPRVH
jgi:molecular chaperone GrpE